MPSTIHTVTITHEGGGTFSFSPAEIAVSNSDSVNIVVAGDPIPINPTPANPNPAPVALTRIILRLQQAFSAPFPVPSIAPSETET